MDISTPPYYYYEWTSNQNETLQPQPQSPPPPQPQQPPQPPSPPRTPPPMPFNAGVYVFFMMLNKVILAGGISLFGMASNIINVIVFHRQGLMTNSSTTLLAGLAISDLIICTFGLIVSGFFCVHICFLGRMRWSIADLATITCVRPFNSLNHISCLIMAFLTFERAVSVTFPFKVKSLFTPKRCLTVVVLIFVLTFIVDIPSLTQWSIKWQIDRLIIRPSFIIPVSIHKISSYISLISIRPLSVFLVIICNLTIVWKVKTSQKFRSTSAKSEFPSAVDKPGKSGESKDVGLHPSHKSSKELKLLRMVNVISVIFTVCYSITIFHVVLFHFVFQFGVDYNWSVEHLVGDITRVLQLLNCSTNTIIYFNMSSRFREEFHAYWKNSRLCCSSSRCKTLRD